MLLRKDLQHVYNSGRMGPKGIRAVLECFRHPGTFAVIVFRFGHWLLDQPFLVRFFLTVPYLILYRRMRVKWGIEIQRASTVGGGFIVAHHGSIFVGARAIIGENFIIHQGVTIGLMERNSRSGAPVIGNNVTLGPGAKVIGAYKIGNNVKVGPNAVIVRDIPDNSIVSASCHVVVLPQKDPRSDGTSGTED